MQLNTALRVDAIKQFLCRFFAPAFQLADLLQLPGTKASLEGKYILKGTNPTSMIELFDLLRAEPFDIKSLPRNEMFQ